MIPIFAEPDSPSTVLHYGLQPNPNPLTAGPDDGPLPDPFQLIVLMKNPRSEPVTIDRIVISVPYGPSSTDLFNDLNAVQWVLSDPHYGVDHHVTSTSVQLEIKASVHGTPAVLDANTSLYLVIYGITPN